MLIKLFEGPISTTLRSNELLITMSDEQVQMMVKILCSEKVLNETALTTETILHDSIKDGLSVILNRI